MGRCNPTTWRPPPPPGFVSRSDEEKLNRAYVSYAAVVAGIKLHIPKAPPGKLAVMLMDSRKPSHDVKSFYYHPPDKRGSYVFLGPSFPLSRGGTKPGSDSMNGANRASPPKLRSVGAQPITCAPPPYSERESPTSTADMNVKQRRPESDDGENQQFNDPGSSCGTPKNDLVDEPPTFGATTVRSQIHATHSSVEELAKIKIEEDDLEEAKFNVSGVEDVINTPTLVPRRSAADSRCDAGELKQSTKASSDPVSDPERLSKQSIPARTMTLPDFLVQHLRLKPVDTLLEAIRAIVKYSRMLQNFRNRDCQPFGISTDVPTTRPSYPRVIWKRLALESILLYHSLSQGTGAFNSWGPAHSPDLSQAPGGPNTSLGDTGGDIWSGRGPGFEEFTLLDRELYQSLEYSFGSFDQVLDVSTRSTYGPASHSPLGQSESPPVPPPPLNSEAVPPLHAQSYDEGFKDAIAMVFKWATSEMQAPPAQPNPGTVHENPSPHHWPASFLFPQAGQINDVFPPDKACSGANTSPQPNVLPQHQGFEADHGQSTVCATQLAAPTTIHSISAPVSPFSPEQGEIDELRQSRAVPPIPRKTTPKHQCMLCPKFYPKPYQLRDHMRSKHEGRAKSHCCEYAGCSKTFTTRSNLMRHFKKEHQVGNVSAASQRSEDHASEPSSEPTQVAGPSTRRPVDPFVVCTPGAIRCGRRRRRP